MAPLYSFILVSSLFFSFLVRCFRSSSRLLQVVFSTVEHLTHEDGPLCNVPGYALGPWRSSPPCPFHVARSSSTATSTAAYLPLHVATSLQSRVFSRRATENGWFNQPDNLHAPRAEKTFCHCRVYRNLASPCVTNHGSDESRDDSTFRGTNCFVYEN